MTHSGHHVIFSWGKIIACFFFFFLVIMDRFRRASMKGTRWRPNNVTSFLSSKLLSISFFSPKKRSFWPFVTSEAIPLSLPQNDLNCGLRYAWELSIVYLFLFPLSYHSANVWGQIPRSSPKWGNDLWRLLVTSILAIPKKTTEVPTCLMIFDKLSNTVSVSPHPGAEIEEGSEDPPSGDGKSRASSGSNLTLPTKWTCLSSLHRFRCLQKS